jgi:hypothetical protein
MVFDPVVHVELTPSAVNNYTHSFNLDYAHGRRSERRTPSVNALQS